MKNVFFIKQKLGSVKNYAFNFVNAINKLNTELLTVVWNPSNSNVVVNRDEIKDKIANIQVAHVAEGCCLLRGVASFDDGQTINIELKIQVYEVEDNCKYE